MTLAVAIAALVLSVISLAFTVYQWQRSGYYLAVNIHTLGPPSFESLPSRETVGVTVTNTGRLPCIVQSVFVRPVPQRRLKRLTQYGYRGARDDVTIIGDPLPRTLVPSETLVARAVSGPDHLPYFGTMNFRYQVVARSGMRSYKSHWLP
jgi:hypothetical protein